MSKWLALARGEEKNSETFTDTQQEPAESPLKVQSTAFSLVSAGCRGDISEKSLRQRSTPMAQPPSDCRHGFALGGRPKTWTGKVVSFDEWRRLREWEKHGPEGRIWNGISKCWE